MNVNSNHDPILQALLDLDEAHLGRLSIQDAIKYLQNNKKLAKQLRDRYNARGYAQEKIQYVQLSIHQQLNELDPNALKVLIYLGMYCAQNGWVSIKQADLARVLNMSLNTLRAAIKILIANGLITEKKPVCRHAPAIWQVNPDVLYSGKRNHIDRARRDYNIQSQFLKREPQLLTIPESRYTNTPSEGKVYYMYLNVSTTEKEPSEAPSTSKSS